MIIDFIQDFKNISFIPYIDIAWDEDTKERGVKTCISVGWLFWELYIDII